MSWWPSLHLQALTVQTKQQISFDKFDEYFITEMGNFLALEENIRNSKYDLMAKTELNASLRFPFVGFILAYMLKSGIFNFPLLFERYPSVLVIEFKKLNRLISILSEYLLGIGLRSFGIHCLLIGDTPIISLILQLLRQNTHRLLCDDKDFPVLVAQLQELTIKARKRLLNVNTVSIISLEGFLPSGASAGIWSPIKWEFYISDVLDELSDFSLHSRDHYQSNGGPHLLLEILEKFIAPYLDASNPIRDRISEDAYSRCCETWETIFLIPFNVKNPCLGAALYFLKEVSRLFLINAEIGLGRNTLFALQKLLPRLEQQGTFSANARCILHKDSCIWGTEHLRKWLDFIGIVHKKMSNTGLTRVSWLSLRDATNVTIWASLLAERNQTNEDRSFSQLVSMLPIAPLIKKKMIETFLA